ncbi:unnamed protein product [Rhizophagus irregularis]|uniref:Protein kinase domain-containing protein n=1 Tax=Rhizophagus irregularis TaxID=588596 RepID=A0A915YRJ1_9GLOM|nr:unnamed protein product [Rhizophagus irregularis]
MMVLNDKCKKCNYVCNAIIFQQNFKNWTSDNDDIDKFIQDTQLSAHNDVNKALEWIPYDKFYNINHIAKGEFGELYKANRIDGNISYWNNKNENWERKGHYMLVNLKSLNTTENLTLEFINKIKIDHEFYGITRDPKKKNYMMVLNNICEECNKICNSIYFQRNFNNWTSGNDDIDKFIQEFQLSTHKYNEISHALEWIPYNKFHNIKHIAKGEFGGIYIANWIDGNLSYRSYWDHANQNWKRDNHNMFVNLKSLNTTENLTLEFINKIKIDHEFYGITRDPKKKNYIMVLNNICEECNKICNSIYFQRKFKNWTSGNDDINKFIQDTQLSAHNDVLNALEWIPYNKFHNIKHIAKDEFGETYIANWIDGNLSYRSYWDHADQNWKRNNHNMFVNLKSLNTPGNLTLEFINKIKRKHKFYGMTQDPETKNYMMVLNNICEKCDEICNSIYFQRNFKNWTSNNDDVDKFIQDTQLSAHYDVKKALEWIPYDRLYDIKYITKDKFGEIYIANWIDGNITNYLHKWDFENQNWERENQNMFVNFKSLNIPENLTLELE